MRKVSIERCVQARSKVSNYILEYTYVTRGDPIVSFESSRDTKAVAVVIILVVALGGIIAYVAPASPPRADDSGATPEGIRSVADANNQFALELYSNIRNGEDGNIFYSPYSIFVALAMTYEGAREQTADEIQSVFHFPSDNTTLRSSLAAIYNELNRADASYMLRTANALWVQQNYPLLEKYLSTIEKYYVGKASKVDFEKATEQARQTINGWVQQETNNRIKDLLPQGILNPLTRLVLTNAIYFAGTWVKQFSESATAEQDFRVSENQTVKVPMMSRTDDGAVFNYGEAENLQILEMQYESGNLSMLVLLPKNGNLTSLEDSLTLEKLDQWRNELTEQRVDVFIPKFSFTAKCSLRSNLIEMGMPTAFTSSADFSGIDGTRDLFIQDVIHKAFIDVNEKGTEAAAATAVVMTLAVSHTPQFWANHPFMFIIQDRSTGNILFLGRVIDPTQ
jgi:serpin B